MKRFVIVVDMQRDFVAEDGALPVPGAEAIVAPLRAWLAALSPADTAGVLFTCDTHDPAIYARSAEAEAFPPHCERATPGWALVIDPAEIDAAIPAFTIEKGVFDMWAEPDLPIVPLRGGAAATDRDEFFAALRQAGVEELTIVGVAADYCVRWAIDGALARGFHVTVPAALTRGIARPIETVAAEVWTETPVAIV